MTKSHGHQQIALFNGLLKRAQKGEPGLSKGAMVLAYDFENEEQLNHALDALSCSQRIAICRSWSCAGKVYSGAKRYSMFTATKPCSASCLASPAVSSGERRSQPPPCTTSTVGYRPGGSGR